MRVPPALDIRPVSGDADVETWVEVHNAASPCWPVGPGQIRAVWGVAPDWSAETAFLGDEAVGVMHVETPHWSPGSRHVECTVIVARGHRRAGIGTRLWGRVSAWGRERGFGGVDVWLVEGDGDGFGFWGNRGFVEVEREQRSALDVAGAVAGGLPADVPEGITLTTVARSPGIERAVYAVALEAMRDAPGSDEYESGDFDHWYAGEFAVHGAMPECGVLAMEGDRVVGYALIERAEARPTVASHSMTGVVRAWRGRGLATAMKREVIRLAHAHGIATLEADNEARNASMLAINRRLGYRPLPASVKLRGPFAPEPA